MIDNKNKSRFELNDNGLSVWANYRILDGKYLIAHVEADLPLRGTGAASRLMQEMVDHARANAITLVPRCSYARAWFERNPQARDVLS